MKLGSVLLMASPRETSMTTLGMGLPKSQSNGIPQSLSSGQGQSQQSGNSGDPHRHGPARTRLTDASGEGRTTGLASRDEKKQEP